MRTMIAVAPEGRQLGRRWDRDDDVYFFKLTPAAGTEGPATTPLDVVRG